MSKNATRLSESRLSQPQYFPIDIRETLFHPFDYGQVEFTYPRSKVNGEVEGGGHHAKVNVLDDVRIPLFGMKLKLKQLHFHSPSEHQVSGVSWPLELHLVHDIEDGQSGMTVKSKVLVIGVFFLGSADAVTSTVLPHIGQSFLTAVQKVAGAEGVTTQTIEFNPNHCLPPVEQRRRFFRYEGSLTSGDLSETASWLVFERPVMVIDKDIQKILEAAEQTPRATEEVNRRVVLRSFT
jgi:carbonic anhydrase